MNAPRTAVVNVSRGKLALLFFALAIVLGLLGLRENQWAAGYVSKLTMADVAASPLAEPVRRSATQPETPPQHPLPAERAIDAARRAEARRAVKQQVNFLVVEARFGFILDDLRFARVGVNRELRALLEERASAIRTTGALTESKEAGALVDMRIKALLGAEYPHFQELDRVAGAMFLVKSTLGVDMAYADQALTPEQELDLAKAMTAVGMVYEGEAYARRLTDLVDTASGLLPMNLELIAMAKEFLSPEQIEVIRKYQEEQLAAVARGAKFPPFL